MGRDAERKNAMIDTICECEAWGDGKMIRVMFDRLFLKPSASPKSTNEVNADEHVIGVGVRAKSQFHSTKDYQYERHS